MTKKEKKSGGNRCSESNVVQKIIKKKKKKKDVHSRALLSKRKDTSRGPMPAKENYPTSYTRGGEGNVKVKTSQLKKKNGLDLPRAKQW